MTLADFHQDPVVLALTDKLIQDNNIDLSEVARIYVGTESSIDGSKPIILIALMEQKFGKLFIRMRRSRFYFCLGVEAPCKTALITSP
jgi:3-hydroxy-3-methylglutaryl CoA synthase